MSELTQVLADLDEQPVALLMDLGLFLQLDRPERGFSFAWTARSTCAWTPAVAGPRRTS